MVASSKKDFVVYVTEDRHHFPIERLLTLTVLLNSGVLDRTHFYNHLI